MPARLLAYGGTSFSERRRIGQWPAIPEATLRDSYGLTANAWCYGMGVIESQPFLIFRQRQNVEQRGGYPFSVLLDPGEPVWERFGWNAASLVEALILERPELLFQTPETCSSDALERLVGGIKASSAAANASPLSYLIAASALEPVLAGSPNRPDPGTFAAALAALPVCFRASRGWLVGGGSAHGKALGASLVIDDQVSTDASPSIETGRRLIEAWESVTEPRALASGQRPLWMWEVNPADYLDAILLLREIQTAPAPTDELITRAGSARAVQPEIDQAISELLTRGSDPLGPKASALLVGFVLQKTRKLESDVAQRLDPETVLAELRRFGSPPKRVPKGLPIPRELRLRMWLDHLDKLRSDLRKNLADSLDQLDPVTPEERQALVQHALAALPGSDEKLTEWNKFQQDPEVWMLLAPSLEAEALRRDIRKGKGAPAKQPEVRPLGEALSKLLFDSGPDSVDQLATELSAKYAKQNSAESRSEMDEVITAHLKKGGAQFAESFADKYFALGYALSFLTASSQDRLIECLRDHNVLDPKARDITYAFNNPASRNSYTRALARVLLKDRELRKRVALQVGDLPEDFERRLKTVLKHKAGRA